MLSFVLITLTPKVALPVLEISLMLNLITIPLSVTNKISSFPTTVVKPINFPFLLVTLTVLTPFPPRPLIGYSFAGVCGTAPQVR